MRVFPHQFATSAFHQFATSAYIHMRYAIFVIVKVF